MLSLFSWIVSVTLVATSQHRNIDRVCDPSGIMQSRISIGEAGGCEQLCTVLRTCAEFGNACPKAQFWALGALANLMLCSQNRPRIVGGEGLEQTGLAGWIHTVLTNSDKVIQDRDVQYAGIACVRELGAAGPRIAAVLRSSGVSSLISKALEMFGETDEELRRQADTAMRYVEYAGEELH